MTTADDVQPVETRLLETMRTMRAMRRLKSDPVPREVLERLVRAASWAPSGGNAQTMSFVVVDDADQLARLKPLWQRVHHWYVAGQGGAVPPMASPTQWQRTLDATKYLADHFHEVPAVIVVCLELSELRRRMVSQAKPSAKAFADLGPRHGAMVAGNLPRFTSRTFAASVYPAVQNLLLAARGAGLGASLTTWHLVLEQEFKSVLGIPKHVATYAIIPVGYPEGRFGPVVRRPVEEFIRWNRW